MQGDDDEGHRQVARWKLWIQMKALYSSHTCTCKQHTLHFTYPRSSGQLSYDVWGAMGGSVGL